MMKHAYQSMRNAALEDNFVRRQKGEKYGGCLAVNIAK